MNSKTPSSRTQTHNVYKQTKLFTTLLYAMNHYGLEMSDAMESYFYETLCSVFEELRNTVTFTGEVNRRNGFFAVYFLKLNKVTMGKVNNKSCDAKQLNLLSIYKPVMQSITKRKRARLDRIAKEKGEVTPVVTPINMSTIFDGTSNSPAFTPNSSTPQTPTIQASTFYLPTSLGSQPSSYNSSCNSSYNSSVTPSLDNCMFQGTNIVERNNLLSNAEFVDHEDDLFLALKEALEQNTTTKSEPKQSRKRKSPTAASKLPAVKKSKRDVISSTV